MIRIKKILAVCLFSVSVIVFAPVALAAQTPQSKNNQNHSNQNHSNQNHSNKEKRSKAHSSQHTSAVHKAASKQKVSAKKQPASRKPVTHSSKTVNSTHNKTPQATTKSKPHTATKTTARQQPHSAKPQHKNTLAQNSKLSATKVKQLAHHKKPQLKKAKHSERRTARNVAVKHNKHHTVAKHTTHNRDITSVKLICAQKSARHEDACTSMRLVDTPVHSAKTGKASKHGKAKVHAAKKTAMNKLMHQLGKPYHWGGTSPGTGFDCSGLVYFAYKDLVKFRIPRTANEMYHLRDAAPVPRDQLKTGDLVFFHTEGRALVDHVGVYIGDDKFIQSPRTGEDVQITSLNNSYWQSHYIGARRIVTPETVR